MSETYLILLLPIIIIILVIILCIYLNHTPRSENTHNELTSLLSVSMKTCITLTHVIHELNSIIRQVNQPDINTEQISQTTNHIETELNNLLQTLTTTKDSMRLSHRVFLILTLSLFVTIYSISDSSYFWSHLL